MNLFFSDTFDTDTATALSSWFTPISGTWQIVSDAGSFSAPNDFQNTTHVDGERSLLKGGGGVSIPATADMTLTYVTKSLGGNQGLQPILRSDATAHNFYVFLVDIIGTNHVSFQLYKSVEGSLSTVGGSVDSGVAYTAGTALHIKVTAIGSTVSAKCWVDGVSEPDAYQSIQTDSSVSTAGYAGFYNAGAIQYAVDNVQLFGNSSFAAGSITVSNITSSGGSLISGVATGGTSPYSYQWYRSTISGFVPQTANLLSGAVNVALNDTGLSTGTTYYYVLVSTDSTGTIVWSSQATITTLASSGLTSGMASLNSVGSTVASVTVEPATGGTSPYSYQWYSSASSGFTPSADNILVGATSQTLNDIDLSPSMTYYYKNVVTDGISATATSNQVTATTGAVLAPGTAYSTYTSVSTVQLSATEAMGGSGAYTLQWYRSTSSGVSGSVLNGATAESVIDTSAAANTDYYYSLQYTDTTGGATAFTPQIHVKTLGSTAQEVIGGIGDSIMAGSLSTFEGPFNAMIDQLNYGLTTKQFSGSNQAISGTTSVDWSATSGGSDLLNAITAFNAAGVTRVVVMLGTNDSKKSVATGSSAYAANLATIVTYLFAHVSTLRSVHLFSPPYQSSTSGDLSVQNSERLSAYASALSTIVNGTTIFYSQPMASYNLFQNNPLLLRDGVHPTDIGDQTLGGLWASNLASDLSTNSTTSGIGSRARVANA